jgi:hypothetical protein
MRRSQCANVGRWFPTGQPSTTARGWTLQTDGSKSAITTTATKKPVVSRISSDSGTASPTTERSTHCPKIFLKKHISLVDMFFERVL